MPRAFVCAVFFACVASCGAVGGGRYAIRRESSGGWTLVNPDGAPVFVVALNHLAAPFYFDAIQGANGLAPCRSYDTTCQEHDLLNTKYGGNWTAATQDFVESSKRWGFNAAGYEYVPAPSVSWPYFPDLFITNASHIFNKEDNQLSFADVFSNEFNATTDQRVAAWVSTDQHINHPRKQEEVIGYYFEDQTLWSVEGRQAQASKTPSDWPEGMRALPASAPGKGAYVDWLAQQYNASAGGLSRAREVYAIPDSIQSWQALRAWDFSSLNGTAPQVIADDTRFLEVVAERLFSVGAAAVRRHDPQALVFGQRFLSNDTPAGVLAAAGRHFDAVSVQPSIFSPINAAQVETCTQRLVNISRLAGLPVMIADSSTHFQENVSGVAVAGAVLNQTAAGEMYALLLRSIRARPEIVGYAHCQYINRAVKGWLPFPHLKQGLLNFDGTPKTVFVDAVTRANKAATSTSALTSSAARSAVRTTETEGIGAGAIAEGTVEGGANITFKNCYDQNCTTTFATAHLDTSLPCSGGCYKDKSNKTFCNSASNFTCLPDRVEYTQHVGVEDCSAHAILTVHTSVHTACTQSKNHEGVIYNQLVNYSGGC